jgi:hypothetical protein
VGSPAAAGKIGASLRQFKLMLCGALPENNPRERSVRPIMSVVTILGVVASAFVLLSLGGLALLRRKFDRIYDGLA